MYLVVDINKKGQAGETVFTSEKGDETGVALDVDIIDNIVTAFGGLIADYAVFHIGDKSNDFKKIKKEKVKYKMKWDGDTPTGIDTDEYDDWLLLKITSDKEIINPLETAIVTYTVYESDGLNIDTSYQRNINIDDGIGVLCSMCKSRCACNFCSGKIITTQS